MASQMNAKSATASRVNCGITLDRWMAPECHLQNFAQELTSQVSSSGGGLPGRPDLARGWGVRHFGRIAGAVLRSATVCKRANGAPAHGNNGNSALKSLGRSQGNQKGSQLVEIVKLTVILAWVSTASLP